MVADRPVPIILTGSPRAEAHYVPLARTRVPKPVGPARPHLAPLAESLRRRRLGMLLAPAGMGKTAAAADTARLWRGRVAWLRCDTDMAEPAVLVAGVLAALATSGAGAPAEGGPEGPSAGRLPVAGPATPQALVRALDRLDDEVLVVLDAAEGLSGSPAEA